MTYSHSNKLPTPQLERKLRDMSVHHEIEDIAALTGMSYAEVQAIVGPQKREFWLRDNRTGKTWRKATQRGLYHIVCFLGLVDWDWGRGGTVGEGALP